MDKLNDLDHILKPSPRMPVIFVGHGNPMNAVLDNEITRMWSKVGSRLPKAQAFVVISAHWQTLGTRITDAPKQPLIYDMYGFPPELYNTTYEANGDPALALQLKNKLLKYEAALDSSWGLDHGTWSVLKHLAPEPKIPVLQISLDVNQSLEELTIMFSYLKGLRKKGVIFIGSGNIVHNLAAVNFENNKAFDWAIEFDELTKDAISNNKIKLLIDPIKFGTSAIYSIPTDDHYRPMLASLSLLEPNESINYFNEVIELGSVGMRSFITQ